MNLSEITPQTTVEDLVESFPNAVSYLLEVHQIRVICCGAPIWAALGELAQKKGISPESICAGLRDFLGKTC